MHSQPQFCNPSCATCVSQQSIISTHHTHQCKKDTKFEIHVNVARKFIPNESHLTTPFYTLLLVCLYEPVMFLEAMLLLKGRRM